MFGCYDNTKYKRLGRIHIKAFTGKSQNPRAQVRESSCSLRGHTCKVRKTEASIAFEILGKLRRGDEPGPEPTSHLPAAHGCEDALAAPGGPWIVPASGPTKPLGREMRPPATRQSPLAPLRGRLASRLRSLLSNRPAHAAFPVFWCSWDRTWN